MKGIILAGGSGTRLWPLTEKDSKQLQPIYDKKMIYYPLSVLMEAGIRDILIISTSQDLPRFENLFEDGSNLGINLSYIVQPSPDGLAQAFILGDKFIGNEPCAMVLGDNIFHGEGMKELLIKASTNAENDIATIFGYGVKDPERFGIAEVNSCGKVLSLEEKPEQPKSDLCVTGLYFYPKGVADYAKSLKPSPRGELEITDLNRLYLEKKKLELIKLGRGFSWFDTGTPKSMLNAANYVAIIQDTQNTIIACLEEIAYLNGWIDEKKLEERAEKMKKNDYGKHLYKVLERGRE